MLAWLMGGPVEGGCDAKAAQQLPVAPSAKCIAGFKTEARQLRTCNAALMQKLKRAEAEIVQLSDMLDDKDRALVRLQKKCAARIAAADASCRSGRSASPVEQGTPGTPASSHLELVSKLADLERALISRSEEWERGALLSQFSTSCSVCATVDGSSTVLPDCSSAKGSSRDPQAHSFHVTEFDSDRPVLLPQPTPSSLVCPPLPRHVDPTVSPPLPRTDKRYTVIFDVDETQVHFSLETFPVHKAELRFRGGIEVALSRLCRYKATLELGLWTAGVPRYACAVRELLSMIAREQQVFDWAIARDPSWFGTTVKKDLTVLNRDLDRTLLIDNSRRVVVQRSNALIVPNFYSMNKGASDNSLRIIASLVEELVRSDGNLTVPEFLAKKAEEGMVHTQGGFYHVPTTLSARG